MIDNRTVFEQMRGNRIPEYYDSMYKDGYQPWEILEAAHNTLIKQHEEREAAAAPDIPMNVKIVTEVHKK